jgi:hypothetical protein
MDVKSPKKWSCSASNSNFHHKSSTIEMRTSPNIIITDTPGVDKSSHCELLAQKLGLKHFVINEVAEQRGCFDGRDEEFGS